MKAQEEPLRIAFAAGSVGAVNGPDCPPPDQLWAAVEGSLNKKATAAIILHTAQCAACAEDWRLTRSLVLERNSVQAPVGKLIPFPQRRWLFPLLAAACIAAGVLVFRPQVAPPSTLREAGRHPDISSLVPAGEKLKRDHCLLRWKVTEETRPTSYEIQITTTDVFQVIAHERDLKEPQYQVPAQLLRTLPSGTRLLWWIRVTHADGTVQQSNTFSNPIGD